MVFLNLHNPTCPNQSHFFTSNIRQSTNVTYLSIVLSIVLSILLSTVLSIVLSTVFSIVVPRTTKSAPKFAFAQRRIVQWNALPSHVAGAPTLSYFNELIIFTEI